MMSLDSTRSLMKLQRFCLLSSLPSTHISLLCSLLGLEGLLESVQLAWSSQEDSFLWKWDGEINVKKPQHAEQQVCFLGFPLDTPWLELKLFSKPNQLMERAGWDKWTPRCVNTNLQLHFDNIPWQNLHHIHFCSLRNTSVWQGRFQDSNSFSLLKHRANPPSPVPPVDTDRTHSRENKGRGALLLKLCCESEEQMVRSV